jgi:hypothetical protein
MHSPWRQGSVHKAWAECTVFLPMPGKNHEGNKSPDIYHGINQRRFLCSRAMKHEATKAYETQGSSLEWSKVGRTPRLSKGR